MAVHHALDELTRIGAPNPVPGRWLPISVRKIRKLTHIFAACFMIVYPR